MTRFCGFDRHPGATRGLRLALGCALALACAVTPAGASPQAPAKSQAPETAREPRSADPWIDAALADINRYGARYPATFTDELVRYHGAPRELVIELLRERNWAPGDVYYACALAQTLGRPCRHVVALRQRGDGESWSELAGSPGVASAQAQRLKQELEASYRRWARPIELVEQMRAQMAQAAAKAPTKASVEETGSEAGKPAATPATKPPRR